MSTGSATASCPPRTWTAGFTRNGRTLGTLESAGDGRVDADWDPAADPTPLDRALGTALAAAFGTGAAPWWETLGDIAAELIP